MWTISLDWNGRRIELATGYPNRDAAEWAVAKWKQDNNMTGDPFSYSSDQFQTPVCEFDVMYRDVGGEVGV